jgi:hypothetical protein
MRISFVIATKVFTVSKAIAIIFDSPYLYYIKITGFQN